MANMAATIASSGMVSNETLLKVISGNIANMNTTAYKASDATFMDLIYINYRSAGSQSSSAGTEYPVSSQIGLGSQLAAISKNFVQGSLTPTPGRPLNIAIEGNGFFQVTMPDGATAYSRDGSFQISANGEIQTAFGYTVTPAITIPNNAENITISTDGIVSATIDSTLTELGVFQLASFANPSGLNAIGDNLYLETTASGAPTVGNAQSSGYGDLLQGYLEDSNVNSVSQVVSMIEAQRGYEFCAKALQAASDMSEIDVQIQT